MQGFEWLLFLLLMLNVAVLALSAVTTVVAWMMSRLMGNLTVAIEQQTKLLEFLSRRACPYLRADEIEHR